MTPKDFSVILDDCLRMMESGAGIEECVARYPQHADELRELLGIATGLGRQREPLPSDPTIATEARSKLLAAVGVQRTNDLTDEPTLGLVAPLHGLKAAARRLLSASQTAPFGLPRLSLVPQALPAVLALLLLGGVALAAAAVRGEGGVPIPGVGGSGQRETELAGTIVDIDGTGSVLTVRTVAGDEEVRITQETELKDSAGRPLTLADFKKGSDVKVRAFKSDGALVARNLELGGIVPAPTATPTLAPPAATEVSPAPADDNQEPGIAQDNAADDEGRQQPEEERQEEEDDPGGGNAEDRGDNGQRRGHDD